LSFFSLNVAVLLDVYALKNDFKFSRHQFNSIASAYLSPLYQTALTTALCSAIECSTRFAATSFSTQMAPPDG